MLRIYLDQKDWIALLKAAADRPERASHADALTLLRAGVDAGAVSLPIHGWFVASSFNPVCVRHHNRGRPPRALDLRSSESSAFFSVRAASTPQAR
jgi:hypothetical protein